MVWEGAQDQILKFKNTLCLDCDGGHTVYGICQNTLRRTLKMGVRLIPCRSPP